jgi:hypothetical protein
MFISTETISYGEVANETILKIFGSEMTYNELKFYAKNINETTHLQVKTLTSDNDTQTVVVWFDSKEVMEKEYPLNHSCDMFYFLKQLDQQCEECGEMNEQGIMCGHGTCHDCRHLCEDCDEEEEEEEEEYDPEDACNECMKGWDAENQYGRCICIHDHCQDLLRNCKYNCC